jgi:MFS transporter, DHA2 family, multidrug resistance protein
MTELIQSTTIDASPHTVAMPAFSRRHLNMLLLGLGFATGMEFYTADSINLCLTDITGSSDDEASWSLTVYSSALFLGVPVCVWLAGYIGHKSYLIGSVVLFAASSVVSATAYSFDTMLWRVPSRGWRGPAWSSGGAALSTCCCPSRCAANR